MKRRWAASLLLVAWAAAASAAPAARQIPIERKPEFLGRVNAAIDRGVAWLKEEQKDDGSFADFPMFPGATTALSYMTLRVCGVPATDRSVKRAWQSLREQYRQQDLATYSAAIYLMAIAEHGERSPAATDERDVTLSKDDRKWAEEIVRWLVAVQDEGGRFSYEGATRSIGRGQSLPTEWDNSNTQYALLGLKAAARCGIAVDPSVWRRSLVHFVKEQELAGPEVRRGTGPVRPGSTTATVLDHARGWNYRERPDKTHDGRKTTRPPYTAMTAGGVSSLVICRSELFGTKEFTAKLDADSERAVWDGLAWIAVNWNPSAELTPNDELEPRMREAMGRGIFPYEFYGVERAGILAGVEWMGERDWYGEGAAALLDRQSKDGSWTGLDAGLMVNDLAQRKRAYHPVDTCFALLFLKRGTVPVTRGAVTSGGDEEGINFAAASKLSGRDLEDFLDLVLGRWRRIEDPEAKSRLFDGAAQAGPVILEPLLLRMESPDATRRSSAHALLRHVTGKDFGWDADAGQEIRDDALTRWQMWWMNSKSSLAYDPATRRIVAR